MSLSTREGPACAQRRSLLALIAQKRQPASNEKSQNERKKMRSMSGAALGMVAKKNIWKSKWNKSVCIFEWSCWPAFACCCCFFHLSLALSLSFRDFLACLRVAHSFAPFYFTLLPSFAAAMMMMNFSFRWAAASLCQLVASSQKFFFVLILLIFFEYSSSSCYDVIFSSCESCLLIGDAAVAVQKKPATKTKFTWMCVY